MEEKKNNKLFSIIISIAIIVVAAISGISLLNQVKPEVTINGQTLRVGMTVQELVDSGFTLGLSITGNGGLNLSVQPQVPGEKYSSTPYYIYKDGEYMDVKFSVYNPNVNSCDFADSKIYSFSFNSRFKSPDVECLVNGINVAGMEKEKALQEFENLGVKFDADDKQKFLNGDNGFIIGKSGNYSFELETDDAKKVIESVTVKNRV